MKAPTHLRGAFPCPTTRDRPWWASPPVAEREALVERLHAAMDDIHEGWMRAPRAVRRMELTGGEAGYVRFSADLSIGPGWMRSGNRRRVDVADARIMKVGIASSPDGEQIWLAMP